MIFDNIANKDNYLGLGKISEALNFLSNQDDWRNMSGSVIIDGTDSNASYIEFTSKLEETCNYEYHKKFIDIHFILEGKEAVQLAGFDDLSDISPFDMDKDIGFMTGKEQASIVLREGDFLVCYPSDPHKVGMAVKEQATIKKIVVKVPVV